MTESTEIRRRPDGSIDTGYYMERGRTVRSEALAHGAGVAAGAAKRLVGSPWSADWLRRLTAQPRREIRRPV